MYILFHDLCQALSRSSKILIYGAGMYANKIYSLLKKAGLKDKIRSFVVTEDKGIFKNIDGINVISVKKIVSFNLEEYIVLIATGKEYCYDIKKNLEKIKFLQILLLTDFIFVQSELRDFSDSMFFKCVTQSYAWDNADNVNLLLDFGKKSATVNKLKRKIHYSENKTIVFLVGYLHPRIVKIIGALHRKGYKTIVLGYQNQVRNALAKDELLKYVDDYFECSDFVELFFMAFQYKPLLYYFEPKWGDCSAPDIMIKHQKLFGKIVISLYDVLSDCYVEVTDKQISTEKYCLENANGIVWRYFSKDFLEDKKGFLYKGKSIQFLDYCGGYVIKNRIDRHSKLKLCLVCGRATYLLDSSNNTNDNYVKLALIEEILSIVGNREDCIFSMFTGYASNENRELCNILEEKYYNFKVYYNTKHAELIEKLSEYDYGCYLYTGGEVMPDMTTVDNQYYGSAYINSTTNRYFDYIDAELPIITTRPIKLCEFLDKYGVVVKMDTSNINIEYLQENKMLFKEKAKKAKKELFIDNQIQKLIDFFEEL